MKILFISARDITKKSYGGNQATNRNYLSFCEVTGKHNVDVMNLISGAGEADLRSIPKWINYLKGFDAGLSCKKITEIISRSKEADYIFIDTSKYGVIAYYLKSINYEGKIITFFHNVELNIMRQRIKMKPLLFWRLLLLRYNEKKAVKYSDKIIALNKRDCNEILKIYGPAIVDIIPISLPDTLKDHKKEQTSTPPTLLFIGNNWYANIHGLKWFVNNVLDKVGIKLQIIGSGIDNLKEQFIHPKIEFLGYVPELSTVLINADYIISPIFTGSGMKVKTCESLMYGKNIIGSKEAFEGYEIDHQKVGAVCNTRDEFINAINDLCSVKRDRFNEYSRKCYLDKYSLQATLVKFAELISE